MKTQQDFDRWAGSYISGRFASGTAGHRALLVDNLKSLRFASADLESLVTSKTIDGHLVYHGQVQVPNTLTLILTGNYPPLSKDFAQRAIPIQINPAEFDARWETDLDDYIETNRWAIIGDLIAQLRDPPQPLSQMLRWATWCGQVLARCCNPDELVRLIRSRQSELDADDDLTEQIREAIVAAIDDHWPLAKGWPARVDSPIEALPMSQKWSAARRPSRS